MDRAEAEGQALATTRQILEAAYLRVLCKLAHRQPESLTQEDREAFLDPWQSAITHDQRLLQEVVRQAQVGAVDGIHGSLHAAPGIDHEMLDQAVAYAGEPGKEPVEL